MQFKGKTTHDFMIIWSYVQFNGITPMQTLIPKAKTRLSKINVKLWLENSNNTEFCDTFEGTLKTQSNGGNQRKAN